MIEKAKDNIKISVIVPVYNTEHYLHCCIDSILSQTFIDFELLLIDDGSKDSSGRICDKYKRKDERIRVFHKDNGGVSSARNLGLDNAKGEYITFLDSDDWIAPQMLDEVYKAAMVNEADMVFVDINYHYPGKDIPHKTYRWLGKPKKALVDYLYQTRSCPGWGLIRSSIIEENHYRFPENLTIYEDFYMMIRLVFQSNVIVQVEKPLYNYRMQELSIVHTTMHERTLKDQRWAYESILQYFKDNGVYELYAPSLYGRILHDYQRFVLDPSLHSEFCKIYPEKKNYIWDCTTINFKLKLMMWCLTHNLSFLTMIFCKVRNLLKK